jgi:hypothetical protein
MADKKISDFTAVTTLGASDLFEIETSGGNSRKITTANASIALAPALDGITDVTAPSPASGDVLTWNGSAWVNSAGASGDDFAPEAWSMRTNGSSTTTYGTTAATLNLSAGTLGTTNYVTKAKRVYTASSAAANSACYCTSGSDGFYGKTGSHFKIRYGMERSVSDTRLLIGLGGTSGLTADPSARTNVIGVGKDAADSNLQIMHNDGSGTCTKVDLGANFPANTDGAAYDIEFNCAAGMGSATYTVTRLDSAFTATGTISTNLPVDTTTGAIGVNAGTGPATPGLALRVAFMAAYAKSNLA